MNQKSLTKVSSVKYQGEINLKNKNNSHTLAYDLIDIDSCGYRCKVLEVGCSTGYFGQALKNAGHEVWGIEMTRTAAEQAKKVLDFVFVGTIQEFLSSESARTSKFDYIVFGDVLEHLAYPSEVLESCKSILKSDGAIVASIPNVAHLAVRVMLLEGRWEYGKLGIMDDTHLHFFDKKAILDLFTQSGYYVQSLDSVRVSVEQTGIRVNKKLHACASSLVKDDERDVFQYVLLTRVAKSVVSAIENTDFYLNKSIRVLCILPDIKSSLAKIRIIDPLSIWAKKYNGLLRVRHVSGFRHFDDAAWADVIVFQREANYRVLRLIGYLKNLGKRIVFDLDDLLTEVPSFLSVHKHSLDVKRHLIKALKASDAVTVTNKRLMDELNNYGVNASIIPNCSSSVAVKPQKSDAKDMINLVIASSDTVRVDFLVPALKNLMDKPEFKFNLVGIGAPGKFIADAGLEIDLYENMPHEAFKSFLSSLPNAIGLIPLDDSKFSSCKSEIKFVDYSLSGLVSVCSSVPPYSESVANEKTGFLVDNNTESWCKAILMLAKSKRLRVDIASAAKQYCLENYGIEKSAEKWQVLLQSLIIPKQKISRNFLRRQKALYKFKLFFSLLVDKSTYSVAMRLIEQYGILGCFKRGLRYFN